MQKLIFTLHFSIFLFVVLLLNGNISVFQKPIPPAAKFLDPYKGVWNHNAGKPIETSTIHAAISKEASIIYDDRWVPHIYANNLEDMLFLQGYVEAQNRLFQMFFLAKAAAGELSSILGDVTLEYDLDKRRRGMMYAAENAVNAWQKMPNFKLANHYIEGVNAYISSLKPEDYPMEFKLFNIKPEPWTILKSALIFKEMSLTLCGKNSDIAYSNLKNSLDPEIFNTWFPEHETVEIPVVPEYVSFNFDSLYGKVQDSTAIIKKILEKSFYESRKKGIGSNQWTVGETKTLSGANIFCNDPHLSLDLPSIWFEQHLVTPDFNAYGVSFPGFPGIMIGFNDFIAWGETNVGQDVEDLFLMEWTDGSKTKYMLDGQPVPVDFRIEKIFVKGRKEPVIDTVRYTHWGPVYRTSADGKSDLAMRWLAHDAPSTEEYMTFIDGMQCRNYREFLKATDPFFTPAQNFGFAGKDGDIAIRVNGILPAKYDQDGRFVEYGNQTSNGWQDYIPKKQNPQVLNPSENFVASANQRSTGKNYPYYYTGNFENFRNKTIHETLKYASKITVQDMQKMQSNAFSWKAKNFISILPIECNDIKGKSKTKWFQKLKNWDNSYKKESTEPVFFEIFVKNLRKNTYDEFDDIKANTMIVLPEDWVLFKMMHSKPDDYLFNIKKTSTIETAKNIQIIAFYQTVQEMDSLLEMNPDLNWGKYNPLHIHHLTRLPALSATNLEADGCPDAINAKGNSFGPSWRMIVHQTTPTEAYGVYPGGQSGNPFSPYYKNMIDDWIHGKYHILNHEKNKEIMKNSARHIMEFKTLN